MKIAVVTLWTQNIAEMAEISCPNKRAYCDRHGYDFVCVEGSLDKSRPPAWSKLLLIHAVLPSVDWVFWTDVDSVVLKPEVRLERYLDDKFDFIFGGHPVNGDFQFNTGNFFTRNTGWAQRSLMFVHGHPNPEAFGWEQGAFNKFWRNDSTAKLRTKIDRDADFNVLPRGMQIGDGFIVHFVGKAPRKRVKLMMDALAGASGRLEDGKE